MKKINRQPYALGIERDLMAAIVFAIKKNRTTEARVQEISNGYLKLRYESVEHMVKGLKELGKKFVEVRDVANTYWAMFIEDCRQIALARGRIYLRNGNIDQAVAELKGGTYYV